jgi:hypothetical protein
MHHENFNGIYINQLLFLPAFIVFIFLTARLMNDRFSERPYNLPGKKVPLSHIANNNSLLQQQF